MTPKKKVSFHDRIEPAIKDLNERVEITEKDIQQEAARLYKYLYEETAREMGTGPGGDAGTDDVTEIPLD
ncbi:MAG: hypothetical protein JXQ30_01500 [Spirochaetes bacterium]|nr:hypothetical protein [Spirochaetota bacterium]